MTPFFIPQAGHEGKFLAVAICYCDGENNSCNAAQFEKAIIRIDEPLIFETRQRQHCIERLDRNRFMNYITIFSQIITSGQIN